jgi:hypothetical protein
VEEFADLFAVEMHRRCDDVRRPFAAQLDDVLAQVCLNDAMACRFERVVQPDLLGDHGFGFGD